MSLFPTAKLFNEGVIQVSDLHQVHYAEYGNPSGVPVTYLHGGPGGGSKPEYTQLFDPAIYRIVLMDQRGCGQSTPFAELRENTTWDLVADLEQLRKLLGINQWIVSGGSWGSTLALAYAITHPDVISHLILRGIFLCRSSELHWFYQEGASHIFPDAWAPYYEFIPPSERADLIKAYHSRLTASDINLQVKAAKLWSGWEGATSKLLPDPQFQSHYEEDHFALGFARIEAHYFINRAFFESDDFLLKQARLQLRHIPIDIVHGRYDVVCPLRSAWDLVQACPHARLEIIPAAGHSVFEPGIASRLIELHQQASLRPR